MGQNEETLPTHPARSETKKVTDKEPTSNRPDPVRNTRTWMKTTSYGKTKQHLFEGLLLGLILLSTQAQAESIICCEAHNAQCLSCKEGKSIEVYCNKDPFVPGCEEYLSDAIRAKAPGRHRADWSAELQQQAQARRFGRLPQARLRHRLHRDIGVRLKNEPAADHRPGRRRCRQGGR